MSHYVVPVKPEPVTPVPAATLVLLRDRSAGAFEVLLIRRHTASKFAAGDFVFPGGKIEASDGPDDARAWCRSVDAAQSARRGTAAPLRLGHSAHSPRPLQAGARRRRKRLRTQGRSASAGRPALALRPWVRSLLRRRLAPACSGRGECAECPSRNGAAVPRRADWAASTLLHQARASSGPSLASILPPGNTKSPAANLLAV